MLYENMNKMVTENELIYIIIESTHQSKLGLSYFANIAETKHIYKKIV